MGRAGGWRQREAAPVCQAVEASSSWGCRTGAGPAMPDQQCVPAALPCCAAQRACRSQHTTKGNPPSVRVKRSPSWVMSGSIASPRCAIAWHASNSLTCSSSRQGRCMGRAGSGRAGSGRAGAVQQRAAACMPPGVEEQPGEALPAAAAQRQRASQHAVQRQGSQWWGNPHL